MVATLMINESLHQALGDKPSHKAKELIAYALENKLTPEPSPVGVIKLPVRFGKTEDHLLKADERNRKGTELTGLIMAAINHQAPLSQDTDNSPPPLLDSLKLKDGRTWRQSQHEMVPQLLSGIKKNKVVALEASTGSGKALGLLATAILDGRPALISSPSIKLVRQLVAEYLSIDVEHSYSVTLGRQAFVSEMLLRDNLPTQSKATQEEITAWLTKNKNGETDSVLDLGWLVEDLIHCCPTLSVGVALSLTLNHLNRNDAELLADEDAGYQAWRASIDSSSGDTQLIFCSHTMLAVDVLSRLKETSPDEVERQQYNDAIEDMKDAGNMEELAIFLKAVAGDRGKSSQGIFGERTLYVDEAHLLEANIANFFSDNLSFFTLNQLARKCECKNSEGLDKAFKKLVDAGRNKKAFTDIPVNQDAVEMRLLREYAQTLKMNVKSANERKPGFSTLKAAAASLARAVSSKNDNKQLYISFSPSHRYPRLTYGKRHLGNEFSTLWGAYRATALVSATLSVPERKYEYVGQTLFIPDNKLIQATPVESNWLHKDVTLHLPDGPEPFLCRPSEGSEDQWLMDLAACVDHIAKHAVGGTLVLCTSYQTIQLLANLVSLDTYQRLIVQSPNDSFEQNEKAFRTSKRPVWLATGRAWTGLDLRSDDNPTLLTDLAISSVPLGMNRTTSYIRRVARLGYHNVAPFEAAILLRQGAGRLKRDDDGIARHLWFLDNRAVCGKKSKSKHFTVPMKTLKDYRAIETFTPDSLM